MEIKKNRVVRHTRNSRVPCSAKGIRAEDEFWARLQEVADSQKTTRNELIVRVMSRYCDRVIKRRKNGNN